jgi:site-specific DNA recombinase
MRAAIYARYSDADLQNARSIDDQVQLCRDLAATLGATVLAIYADYGISGDLLITRPEAQRLIREAPGRYDIILAEGMDRLSRGQRDIADLYERLTRFAGIKLHTFAEGEVDVLKVGFKGTMNAVFLRDLAQKVRRGQAGRARAGLTSCGLGYGYRVTRLYDPAGEPVRGHREIEPDEAAVIRRIFQEYADGKSALAIAAALNREGIPAPRGGAWGASTIQGNRARGSGILNNEAYAGVLIYNRTTFVKHPDTGKRLSRDNPESSWLRQNAPELRIVDAETWRRVKVRQGEYQHCPMNSAHRPKHLFSGLIRCGVCGASYTTISRDRIGCAGHAKKGNCANSRRIARPELERRVIDGLKRYFLLPDAITAAVAEYHADRRRRADANRGRRSALAKKIGRLDQGIARLVDAIRNGTATPASNAALVADEAERAAAAAELTALDHHASTVVELHPRAIEAYRERIERLAEALATDQDAATAEIVRGMVDRIDVQPSPAAEGGIEITAYGAIANLVLYAAGKDIPGRTVSLVAGGGFEPPTFGL